MSLMEESSMDLVESAIDMDDRSKSSETSHFHDDPEVKVRVIEKDLYELTVNMHLLLPVVQSSTTCRENTWSVLRKKRRKDQLEETLFDHRQSLS